MSPRFSPDVHDYTLAIPDTEYSFYPFLTFRSSVPDDFAATFQFEDLDGEAFASGTKLDAAKLWQGEAGSRHFITPQTFQDANENTVVTVSYGRRYVGGIIGCMHSLDCYNVITNNYYLAGSATSGIDKEKASASLLVYFTDDYTFDSVPVITAAIDALSSSLTEGAISSIDTQLKALSPVALASIPNLELLAQSRDMLAVNKAAAAIDAIGDVTLSSGNTSGGSVWYEAGRQRAMENGISDGTNIEDVITREQLVTMLCRYAQMKGCDVSDLASLSCYTDASGVSDWALQSMQWAVSAGLIAGRR